MGTRLAVVTLSVLCLAVPGVAAVPTLLGDSDWGPPAACLQDALGFGAEEAALPVALDAAGRLRTAAGADEGLTWAAKALLLRPKAGAQDWARAERAWSLYSRARRAELRTWRRTCAGGEAGEHAVVDVLDVVLAPAYVMAAFQPEFGHDEPRRSQALVPVVGAVGLATDPLFLLASPFVRLQRERRARASRAALDAFAGVVRGWEASSAAARPPAAP